MVEQMHVYFTVEENDAIQTDLFVYTRFPLKKYISQVIVKKQVSKHAQTYLV